MKLSDFATFIDNPFDINGVNLKHIVRIGEAFEVVNTETGEVEIMQKAGNQISFNKDSLAFKKVYSNAIGDIKNFSPPALKVWCYLMENININKDDVGINMHECAEYTGYDSRSPLYKGICELIDKGFIARKVGMNMYFINSNKFFNGTRSIDKQIMIKDVNNATTSI